MGRLEGKRAFVTAAGQGIGRATAEAFIAEGAEVHATDLDADKLHDLAAEETFALDARDSAAINAASERIGAVDILFNCAGFVHQGTILETSEDIWDFSFDLNVKSMHRTISAFLPAMLDNGGGSIVNISSVVSSIKGSPNRYVYGSTKAAVIGLTKAVAADFIKRSIRCNAICPGTIDTPSIRERMDELAEELGSHERALQWFLDRQPGGKMAPPEAVANMAVFLASDEAEFVTGTVNLVDGGWAN